MAKKGKIYLDDFGEMCKEAVKAGRRRKGVSRTWTEKW